MTDITVKHSTHAIGALLLVFVLAACGDDGDAATLQTTTTEYAFDPSSWTVEAGSEQSIDVTNEGQITHEWVVLAAGRTIESEAELPDDEDTFLSDWVYTEVEAEPGEAVVHDFTAPDAGTYQVICAIPGHFDEGMEGTLTVE